MDRFSASFALFALALAACGDDAELREGFETSLTVHGACAGDVYAGSPDGELIVVFKPDEGYGAIASGGGARSYDFASATPGATLYAEIGSGLADGLCSSTTSGTTDARYHAIGGTATLDVSTLPSGSYSADLTLADVLLHKEHADHEVPLPSRALTGIEVP